MKEYDFQRNKMNHYGNNIRPITKGKQSPYI